jgi:hypothetical protein
MTTPDPKRLWGVGHGPDDTVHAWTAPQLPDNEAAQLRRRIVQFEDRIDRARLRLDDREVPWPEDVDDVNDVKRILDGTA